MLRLRVKLSIHCFQKRPRTLYPILVGGDCIAAKGFFGQLFAAFINRN